MYNHDDNDEEIAAIKQRKMMELQKNIASKLAIHNISAPVILTDINFKDEILKYPFLVVDFWAPWCGPCRMVSPIIEQLAKEYSGKIVFGKVNVEENQIISTSYGIQSIPTIIMFRKGKILDVIVGALPKAQIEFKIKQLLLSH